MFVVLKMFDLRYSFLVALMARLQDCLFFQKVSSHLSTVVGLGAFCVYSYSPSRSPDIHDDSRLRI